MGYVEQPLVVDRKDGTILVRLHWGRFRVECDTAKYEVAQGLCDSGSTITLFLTPKSSVVPKGTVEAKDMGKVKE